MLTSTVVCRHLAELLTEALAQRSMMVASDVSETVIEWNSGYVSGLSLALGTLTGIDPHDRERLLTAVAEVGSPERWSPR